MQSHLSYLDGLLVSPVQIDPGEDVMTTTLSKTASVLGAFALTATMATSADARIVRVEITKTEPAFAGATFGSVGGYLRLTGKAYGEVDPNLAQNTIIQDLSLAPRNAPGLVEYVTDIEILKPVDMAKSNNTLLVEVHNRGRKLILRNFNDGVSADTSKLNNLVEAGDGLVWLAGRCAARRQPSDAQSSYGKES
jgi:hypothetical protein